MNRRDFIKIAGLSLIAPQLLAQKTDPTINSKTLVLLELKGGNDGLNTVVPYSDEKYYKLRPQLAVRREQVLQLSPELGLNPVMEKFMPIWQEKELAVICGVGYPEPNRSHFRSIEIWETGSDSNDYLQDGWIARLFEESDPGKLLADGIILGNNEGGPLAGLNMRNIFMRNPKQFFQQAKKLKELQAKTNNNALKHLLKVQQDIHTAAQDLEKKVMENSMAGSQFPPSQIGKQLQIAANIITSDTPVAVIKVSHGGFDTHSGQRAKHDRLLQQLSNALHSFRKTLIEKGKWNDTLVMTYSEFGRRAYENGSKGTDHGTAAPHFMMGGKVRGGIYGKQPELTELKKGDLVYHVDYRSMYSTVANKWWNVSNDFSKDYEMINCIKS
ncbi:DUF1501 domain-containing protein [Candidatus Uabimicrobium amorphum]|uniref:Twin-arginine translocation pathway signal sequence domain-containing protein n=1 Tax=Uabimicrobium amorphum TaxID=2596890 RepID=A0A5S9ISL5_UABAM|nr:DUF1501 domain-containing protein [Candidatus Uabimicrobium amorphum]BBM86987.1 hypothetical protein UABAM_05389 [Candidatus Uabimicrobium amorphum]